MPCTHILPFGNTSHNPVRKAQHSHLTMRGTNPAFMSERLCTYIRHMRGTNPTYMFEKALHLHSTHARNQSDIHVRKGSALTFNTCEEPIQHTCLKGLCTYFCTCEEPIQHACQKGSALTSAHARNQSSMHVRRACTHI